MNKELEKALECRLSLIECLNKAKEVYESIYCVEFQHYQSRKIAKFDWTQW